jgi:dUTP pyrophosphatase
MELKVKLLDQDAKLPTKAYPGDAAFDLYSIEAVMLKPGQTVKIRTGIALEIPEGYYGQIADRSSLAKCGIKVFGGVIDSKYRGEVQVLMSNLDTFERIWQPLPLGARIAQLIILPVPHTAIVEVTELESTERADKGFGSSGI